MRKPCCEKEATMRKGAWSKQEDQMLIDYIQKHGEGCWRALPQAAGLLRCGKSCRLRWVNYLRPDLKRGNFGEDEEDLIIKLHALLGNRWSLIAGRLPGRTDNEVKNYWNTHLRRKLIRLGIDPNNHRPGYSGSSKPVGSNNSMSKLMSENNNDSDIEDNNSSSVLQSTCDQDQDQEPESHNNNTTTCSTTGLPDLNLELTIGAPFIEEIKTSH